MRIWAWVVLLGLVGCEDPIPYDNGFGVTDHAPGDDDNDGYTEELGDCNLEDGSIHPGAVEIWYDGIDQDCDGSDDDQDGDGVLVAEDCDDTNAAVLPGAPELCDGLDNDCDGEIDDGAPTDDSGYADADGDGAGDPDAPVAYCITPPAGVVTTNGDCDDTNAEIYPTATELCDGIDNNCNGRVDVDVAEDVEAFFYTDGDRDGYGRDGGRTFTGSCEAPTGYASVNGDCDDDNADVHPGAEEVCDSLDNDCDGGVDLNADGENICVL